MDLLPISLNIRARACLVVGGGAVAARKAELLMRAGAAVTVVAPALGSELQRHRDGGRLCHRARKFVPEDLAGCALVIGATDDPAVNRDISMRCRQQSIPVNVVDAPALCTFVIPSIVDRSPVVVAVSSAGQSPVLARQLRARIESLIPSSYGRLAVLAGRFRDRVKRRFQDVVERRRFWEEVLQGPVGEMMLAGRERVATLALELALQRGSAAALSRGEVYLVGAGPGDPDLLTFRALRLMQQADAVVYDHLVSPPILDLVRREANRIDVGKKRDRHPIPQEEINRLLVRLARAGNRVLRLKGGDPFIFGRGGEEIAYLAEKGIPFQVVPGITAALGCAAYAGIPLTHRDLAHVCIFVPGHLKEDAELDWHGLARPRQTVVIYMGRHNLEATCGKLVAHGLSGATPAALIQDGTREGQRVVVADLATLPTQAQDAPLDAPTLLIIGEVVRLHRQLAWFEPANTCVPQAGWAAAG